MKKAAAALLLAVFLIITSCGTDPTVTEETTATETDETISVTVTEKETETETETDTEAVTETDIKTETEAETGEETTAFIPEPEKADTPVIKGRVLTEPGMAMIYGECEEDAILSVVSELEEFTAHADGRFFAVPAELKDSGATDIFISAYTEQKTESEAAYVSVKNNSGADDTGVAVTLGSRVIEKKVLYDQYGTNGFSKSDINAIKDAVRYRMNKAEKAAGKPVKLVYIVVPDPLTVYPEELTDQMRERIVSPNLRMKQTVEALESVEGVVVLDLTETLKDNKQNGKLYYKLDSHWTELGAFYGYQAVMKKLGLPYHELTDYKVDHIDIDDTDMNVYSGVGTGEMYESAPFLSALFEEKTPYGKNKEDTARIWSFVYEYFSGQTSKTVTDEGPAAMFLFDSYGLNIIPYLSESFGTFLTEPIWKYSVDYSLVSEIKPDYIIELLAERNLDELLSAA